MVNHKKKQEEDMVHTEIKLEEKKEKLEEKKLQNEMLRADVIGRYAESITKIIGGLGLFITTITQGIITFAKIFNHGVELKATEAIMMSDEGMGTASGIVESVSNKATELFSLPQYGLFGLMIIFTIMIFIKKKKKETI